MIWRINGQNVNIWEDPWVPRGSTRRPSTVRGQILLQKVCDLIDPISGQWDQDLVQQVFNDDDVPHILSIPIKEGFDDLPAWHPDPKGNFSVRSSYKLKLQLDDVAAGQTSSSTIADPTTSTAKVWTKLWSLKMPRKIIMFL